MTRIAFALMTIAIAVPSAGSAELPRDALFKQQAARMLASAIGQHIDSNVFNQRTVQVALLPYTQQYADCTLKAWRVLAPPDAVDILLQVTQETYNAKAATGAGRLHISESAGDQAARDIEGNITQYVETCSMSHRLAFQDALDFTQKSLRPQ